MLANGEIVKIKKNASHGNVKFKQRKQTLHPAFPLFVYKSKLASFQCFSLITRSEDVAELYRNIDHQRRPPCQSADHEKMAWKPRK